MKMRISLVIAILLLITVSAWGQEEIDFGLQIDLVIHNTNAKDYTNLNFHGGSVFNTLRARIIAKGAVNDYLSFNGQMVSVNAGTPFWFSAYAHLSKPDFPYLNLNLGLIPTPVGLFGHRTYADKNPLIGVPLIYNYHTNINFNYPATSNSQLLALRGQGYDLGSYSGYTARGVPIIYDACWNSGINLFGSFKFLDYSVAALSGALAYPKVQIEDRNPNLTAQMVVNPVMGVRAGLFGSWGPYFSKSAEQYFPAGKTVDDFNQVLGGALAEISYWHLESYHELVLNAFEHPYLGYLKNNGFYSEVKYKFLPSWYGAVRYDQMNFNKVEDETNPGSRHTWDYNVKRVEAAIGYYLDRKVLLKLDAQINRFPDQKSLNDEIYALQMTFTL